jgi:hypothetical protein
MQALMSSVGVAALLEMALLCAIPYLVMGAIVAGAHGEGLHQVQVEQGTTRW